jgi:hypothetical protein
MFEITIKGETLEDFHANLQQLAAQFGGVPTAQPAKTRKASAKAETETQTAEPNAPADDVDRELTEEVPPAPDGASAVVDAGTGQPLPKGDAAPLQMTFDDVKKHAAKLAATDTGKLAEILAKYEAKNLSGVPKDKLGDFAGDVMEALG